MSKDTDTQALSLESGFDEWYAGRPYTREVLNPQGYARMVWRAASKHRAALAAAEAQPDHIPEAGKMVQPVAVPQGWKLAPMEPTVGMCIAGDEARANVDDLTRTPAIYRAMLAAAPAAQAPVSAAIWQWLTADGESICERWQAILERWDGSDGRAGIEAAAVAAMRAHGSGGKA